MIFSNLWGLFGFLGIVALIIIYILKPKYQDKTVSSTFVWKLSLKYRKPKTPFDWLKSSLLFILQILILTIIGLLLLEPSYELNTISGEKIVILDASASMHKDDNKGSHFERAKTEIIKLAEQTAPKDRFTVIIADNDSNYAVRRSDSIDYIKQSLTNLKPTYEAVDLTKSLDLLDSVLRENPNSTIYLFTDKDVSVPSKINVIDVTSTEWNVGILDFKGNLKPNGYYMFEADVINYGGSGDFTLTLYVDGQRKMGKTITNSIMGENETIRVIFEEIQVLTYQEAYVTIDVNDGYPLDNEFRIYGQFGKPYKVQIFSGSDDPSKSTIFFVRSALESLNKRWSIDVITDEEDLESTEYDLYIYDTYIPDTLPSDGSIWIFNPTESYIPLPISIDNEMTGDFQIKSDSSQTEAYRRIMNYIQTKDMNVTKYQRIFNYPQFEKILSYGTDPLLMTKDVNGQKISIFAFDLAYSNLPVLVDFPLLIQNLFEYSIPSTVNKHLYLTGTELQLEPKLGAYQILVHKDGVDTIYDDFPINLKLELPGTYKVTQKFVDKADESTSFFVRVPKEESFKDINGGELILPHIPSGANQGSLDLLDLIPYLALGLLALLLIEWGVQYREQF